VRATYTGIIAALADTLRVGQQAGVVDPDLDADGTARVLVAIVNGLVMLRAAGVGPDVAPPTQAVRAVLDRLLLPATAVRDAFTARLVRSSVRGSRDDGHRARREAARHRAEGGAAGVVASRWAAGDTIARLAAPAGRADPYPIYRRARESGLLVPTMIGLVTAHHGVAAEVLRDHERFGSAPVPRPEGRRLSGPSASSRGCRPTASRPRWTAAAATATASTGCPTRSAPSR
jgi:hypothetical protein